MTRALVLGALGAVVLLVLLALAAPPVTHAYEAPIPREERARNAGVLVALAAAGFERAWVDAQDASVLVVYERPDALAPDDAQAYALGAAALVAREGAWLTARAVDGPTWRALASDVQAYQAGSLTRAELEARIERG